MNTSMLRLVVIVVALLAFAAPAAALDQVNVGAGSGQEGASAVVPVALSGTGAGTLNLMTATISSNPILGVPTVAPGPGQPNLLAGDAFVDALSPGVYRVTCFVRTTPNMQSGAGALVNLTYSLVGVPPAVYPLTLTTSQIFDVANADTTQPGTNGSITVTVVPVELSAFSLE